MLFRFQFYQPFSMERMAILESMHIYICKISQEICHYYHDAVACSFRDRDEMTQNVSLA